MTFSFRFLEIEDRKVKVSVPTIPDPQNPVPPSRLDSIDITYCFLFDRFHTDHSSLNCERSHAVR